MQLHLLTAPERPGVLALARAARDAARARCLAVWGRGVVLRSRGDRVRLTRGRRVLLERVRLAGPIPGALDAPGWLLREARAWHLLSFRPDRCRGCRGPAPTRGLLCRSCRAAERAAEREERRQRADDLAFDRQVGLWE